MSFGKKDTLGREGGHGSLRDFGNSFMEIGRWEYTGISWDFGAGGAQWGRPGENAQEEPCPSEGEGYPGIPAGGGKDGLRGYRVTITPYLSGSRRNYHEDRNRKIDPARTNTGRSRLFARNIF